MKKFKINPFIPIAIVGLLGMGKWTLDMHNANKTEVAIEQSFVKEDPLPTSTPEVIAKVDVDDSTKVEVTPEITPEITPEVTPEIIDPSIYQLIDDGYEFKNIDFEKLNETNEEVVGWLDSLGVINDFAIVQASDNEKYLRHNIYGEYYSGGNPFMDYRSSDDGDNLNRLTIVYGHHMKDGTGFAGLCGYKKAGFLDEHPYGVYYDEDGEVYKISYFAGIIVSGHDSYMLDVENMTDGEYNDYLSLIKSKSTFASDIEADIDDKLFALVTCTYEADNSRFILYGIMEKQNTSDLRDDKVKTLSR